MTSTTVRSIGVRTVSRSSRFTTFSGIITKKTETHPLLTIDPSLITHIGTAIVGGSGANIIGSTYFTFIEVAGCYWWGGNWLWNRIGTLTLTTVWLIRGTVRGKIGRTTNDRIGTIDTDTIPFGTTRIIGVTSRHTFIAGLTSSIHCTELTHAPITGQRW